MIAAQKDRHISALAGFIGLVFKSHGPAYGFIQAMHSRIAACAVVDRAAVDIAEIFYVMAQRPQRFNQASGAKGLGTHDATGLAGAGLYGSTDKNELLRHDLILR